MKSRTFILALLVVALPSIIFAQWNIQSSAFNDSLRGLEQISVVDNNVAWAIAYDGSGNNAAIQEITKTTDGGVTWIVDTIGIASGLLPTAIFALNADTAWTMFYNPNTDGGKVFRTNDGGQSWTHQATALFVDTLEAYPDLIYFWNKNEGVCVGDATNGYAEIYTTSNGGNLWTRVSYANMPALITGEYFYSGYFATVDNSFWFGTSKGNIYKTNDKGLTWSSISNPFLNNGKVRVIQFKDSLNGIIGDRSGDSFTLYRTSNGGTTWQAITPTGPVYGRSISYVPGTPGTIISTSNASALSGSSISYDFGNTWSVIPGSSGMKFTCLSNFYNQTGWAGLLNSSSTVGGVARYKILSLDAGISQLASPLSLCEDQAPVEVTITNYGFGLLDSVIINWEIGGIPQTAVHLNTPIGAGNSLDITLGSYNFIGGNNYPIKAYTSSPNGLTDTLHANDTLISSISVFSLPIVNLGIDTIIFVGDSLLLDAGSIYYSYLWSTGDTTQTIMANMLNMPLFDNFFWVQVENQNGCFGSDTITISYLTGIQDVQRDISISIYPNPSSGRFTISLTDGVAISDLQLYDNLGRLLSSKIKLSGQEINLEAYQTGIYFLKIVAKDRVYWRKLLIKTR